MTVTRAGIHELLVKIENREYYNQTASEAVSAGSELFIYGRQLVFKIFRTSTLCLVEIHSKIPIKQIF